MKKRRRASLPPDQLLLPGDYKLASEETSPLLHTLTAVPKAHLLPSLMEPCWPHTGLSGPISKAALTSAWLQPLTEASGHEELLERNNSSRYRHLQERGAGQNTQPLLAGLRQRGPESGSTAESAVQHSATPALVPAGSVPATAGAPGVHAFGVG